MVHLAAWCRVKVSPAGAVLVTELRTALVHGMQVSLSVIVLILGLCSPTTLGSLPESSSLKALHMDAMGAAARHSALQLCLMRMLCKLIDCFTVTLMCPIHCIPIVCPYTSSHVLPYSSFMHSHLSLGLVASKHCCCEHHQITCIHLVCQAVCPPSL